jgi:hypothetical protein
MNKKMLDEEEDDLFSLSGSSMGKKGRACHTFLIFLL